MPVLVEGTLSKVTVGDEVHYVIDGDTHDYMVVESCTYSRGVWCCVTHNQGFVNNFEKDSHIRRGSHTLAWLCLDHGMETP